MLNVILGDHLFNNVIVTNLLHVISNGEADSMQIVRIMIGQILSFVRTIRSADRILVIHNGRIRESGTHEELMAQRGEYYSLYTHQYRREATQAALE
mgnify:CR=1 FL=1